ncbi:hypothetical protein NQ318_021235 [Aromia moschata]|uniref:Uncharacterized protein n=1 Tax=Aromia moschata TaxID=1265417 RepID=A0AAV8XYV0_9CUCU|nr:hypothetical protein NQ318_021235 [Aromia moschata]
MYVEAPGEIAAAREVELPGSFEICPQGDITRGFDAGQFSSYLNTGAAFQNFVINNEHVFIVGDFNIPNFINMSINDKKS